MIAVDQWMKMNNGYRFISGCNMHHGHDNEEPQPKMKKSIEVEISLPDKPEPITKIKKYNERSK